MDLFERAARKSHGPSASPAHVRVERREAGMAWVRGCTGTLAQVLLDDAGRVLCPGCHEWLPAPGDTETSGDG